MDVLILTLGSRGDVQPFVALAQALANAGHSVRLGTPAASASLVRSYGLRSVPLSDGPVKLSTDPVIRDAFETNLRGLRGKKLAIQLARKYRATMDAVLNDIADAARPGADVVVHHVVLPGQQLGEWLGVPALPVCMQPFWAPTRAFPNPMHALRMPRALNRLSYITSNAWYQLLYGRTRRWRAKTLGLPMRRGYRDLLRRPDGGPATLLQAFSAHLLAPQPADYPPWIHTTGFWRLPAPPDWTPPGDLSEFLERDNPPIYIGFGSMSGVDPERTGRVIREAVRLAGARAVIATGWGGIATSQEDENLLFLRDVPHDWLFKRVSAVVHHAGSGTSGAALAAGRPQVVCPFFVDQPYFAQRMHALGVAPAPLHQRDLEPTKLAHAIEDAVSNPFRANTARELGRRVRAEGGVEQAVRIIEATLQARSSRTRPPLS